MLSREELAYIAGVLDSDGCITLPSNHPIPKIMVTNTKEVLPQWFADRLGGQTYHRRPTNLRWSQVWCWVLVGESAVELLKQVRQWLVLKREQANVVIDLWAKTQDMRQRVGQGRPRSAELQEIDAEYVDRIRVLNKRGALKEA